MDVLELHGGRMTTVEPYKGKRRRDCTRCHGEAAYRVVVYGKLTKVCACIWCAKRVKAGQLEVRGELLVEPRRVSVKRSGES
jgi:hypothetical protein